MLNYSNRKGYPYDRMGLLRALYINDLRHSSEESGGLSQHGGGIASHDRALPGQWLFGEG